MRKIRKGTIVMCRDFSDEGWQLGWYVEWYEPQGAHKVQGVQGGVAQLFNRVRVLRRRHA